jgi:uncharacterized membrane protein YgcG
MRRETTPVAPKAQMVDPVAEALMPTPPPSPPADANSTTVKKESTPLIAKDDDEGEPLDSGALDNSGTVNIYSWRTCGYLGQYFAVGMINGGLPSTHYALFIVYLNVPSYVASAASVLAMMAWVLKIFFALLSDTRPIHGYRRRPYMMIGWSIAFVFLIALACTPMPAPYFCQGPDGTYNLKKVCNPAAKSSGYVFALMMMMVSVGVVLADVSADALTVAYARREPESLRGQTQTTAYLVREVGMITSKLLVGFGMNGKEYNGSFPVGLSFSAVCAILAVPAALMVPISWLLVPEHRIKGSARSECSPCCASGRKPPAPAPTLELKKADEGGDGAPPSKEPLSGGGGGGGSGGSGGGGGGDDDDDPSATAVAQPSAGSSVGSDPDGAGGVLNLDDYWGNCWNLLCSGAMFEVLCYQFFSGLISGIGTTAGSEVQRVWANVQNLQSQLFGIAGSGLFCVGLWLMRAKCLNVSWRLIIVCTVVISNVIDIPFTFITVYDIVRNQYLWLDDSLILAIPSAMGFVVNTYVIVEMAEAGAEGITYGILTTAANLGGPVANAIGNAIFGTFRPSLSDASNYVADTPHFRNVVALSYVISYCFTLLALVTLPLMPDQKADTRARKASRPRHRGFAYASIGLLSTGLVYSLTTNLLTIFPATSCLEFVGGPGCDPRDHSS